VTFACVDRLPSPGEIVVADGGWEEDAGGGGAIAAVQLARLAGEATLFTALGADGEPSRARLEALGVRVRAAQLPGRRRRAFTHLEAGGERTITLIGDELVPHGADPLGWDDLADVDGVFLAAGDGAAARAARAARVLVATSRAAPALAAGGVPADVLVHSASDRAETAAVEGLRPEPEHLVATRGAEGGAWSARDGRSGAWAAAELPGPPVDAFGCGDAFAAALTFGLARGDGLDAALALAAQAGAAVLTGRGPYERQIVAAIPSSG
jgi:ribokinase